MKSMLATKNYFCIFYIFTFENLVGSMLATWNSSGTEYILS